MTLDLAVLSWMLKPKAWSIKCGNLDVINIHQHRRAQWWSMFGTFEALVSSSSNCHTKTQPRHEQNARTYTSPNRSKCKAVQHHCNQESTSPNQGIPADFCEEWWHEHRTGPDSWTSRFTSAMACNWPTWWPSTNTYHFYLSSLCKNRVGG